MYDDHYKNFGAFLPDVFPDVIPCYSGYGRPLLCMSLPFGAKHIRT